MDFGELFIKSYRSFRKKEIQRKEENERKSEKKKKIRRRNGVKECYQGVVRESLCSWVKFVDLGVFFVGNRSKEVEEVV